MPLAGGLVRWRQTRLARTRFISQRRGGSKEDNRWRTALDTPHRLPGNTVHGSDRRLAERPNHDLCRHGGGGPSGAPRRGPLLVRPPSDLL
jgi:hypothetical protein